jgi:hypothetical protein
MHASLLGPLGNLLHNAPSLILLGCAALFLVFLWYGAHIWMASRRVHEGLKRLTATLDGLSGSEEGELSHGLSLERKDAYFVACESLNGLPKAWWTRITQRIDLYRSPEDRDGWFLTENPRRVLPYDVVVGRNFHTASFSAFPGILTGSGLTLTFIAILLGLLGVHYDKANSIEPISGIDTLINGLSGKFLSSIVALLLSIIFTLIEKRVVRGLREAYEDLLTTIGDAIPFLSTTQILLDMHRFSAKQTISVSNFSSDFVDKFKNLVVPGLASEMSSGVAQKLQDVLSPTMDRMVGSLDSLEAAILRLESQKQDSVTGELERMAKALEESITHALSNMGKDFREALSGSAQDEFGNVQGTLEATRHVLSEMTGQFVQMQTALGVIIAKAEETTTDQLKTGREQTEALSALMHGLMNRLQETAEQNLNNVQSQLMRVVSDLTEKVTGLSVDMMDAAKEMAGHSQQSASSIIEKTDAWSEATAKRLESLLANIENRSQDFKEASAALLEAKTFMNNLLAQNANALGQMAEASRNVQTYSSGLVGQSDALRAISGDHVKVANQLLLTAGGMKTAFEHHEKLLGEYRRTVTEYKDVIDSLHEPLARIMQATSTGLRDYNQSVERNFTKIVEVADKLVPKAANLLSGQIEDFGSRLEALGDVITKAVERSNGRPR